MAGDNLLSETPDEVVWRRFYAEVIRDPHPFVLAIHSNYPLNIALEEGVATVAHLRRLREIQREAEEVRHLLQLSRLRHAGVNRRRCLEL